MANMAKFKCECCAHHFVAEVAADFSKDQDMEQCPRCGMVAGRCLWIRRS